MMREEQMRGGLISSIHIKLLRVKFVLVLKHKDSKKNLMFFSFTDVNARTNLPWINRGVSVDS